MKLPAKQKGLVLVILVIVIVLAFISYIVGGLSATEVKIQRDLETSQALKKAKQALIAYAVNYSINPNRGPGYFPCPDLDNTGDSGVNDCQTGGIPNVARLPWYPLGIGDLRDGANERLWYAVSNSFDYSNSPTVYKVNTATTGTLTIRDRNNNIIYDASPGSVNAAVAVIIAPGIAITRDDGVVQNRSSFANQNAAINYLDIDTSSGEDNASFAHSTLDGFIKGEIFNGAGDIIVNDRIVVITYGEIMEQIHKRVAGEIANILNNYFSACNTYPEAAPFNPNGGDFKSRFILLPPPVSGGDLREGLLPVTQAWPVTWGGTCGVNPVPVLPLWLTNEDWHKLTYYAFAHDSFTADGGNCGTAPNPPCMTVKNTTPPINNAQALIVFAGRDFKSVGTASSNTSDYFEGDNYSTLDGTYDAGQLEDYVRVVTP